MQHISYNYPFALGGPLGLYSKRLQGFFGLFSWRNFEERNVCGMIHGLAAAAGFRAVMDNDHLPPLLSILYSSHSQLADLLV